MLRFVGFGALKNASIKSGQRHRGLIIAVLFVPCQRCLCMPTELIWITWCLNLALPTVGLCLYLCDWIRIALKQIDKLFFLIRPRLKNLQSAPLLKNTFFKWVLWELWWRKPTYSTHEVQRELTAHTNYHLATVSQKTPLFTVCD